MTRRACVAAHSRLVAEAFAHFSGEVLPACVAVLTREHELGVALRSRAGQHVAVAPGHVRWPRRHRRRCRARVSWPVSGGIRGTDEQGETSKWSLRPPFMNRLYPAETRLKEGAKRTRLRTKQVGVFPCRGWVAPCRALPAVSRDCRFDVKRGEGGSKSKGEPGGNRTHNPQIERTSAGRPPLLVD